MVYTLLRRIQTIKGIPLMIKHTKIKISFFLSIFVTHFFTQAIQNSTANAVTFFVASVCAGSSYTITQELPGKIHTASLLGVSAVVTAAAYYLLHRATPLGRIKRANTLLNELCRHTLARVTFDTDRAFFDAVQDVYLTDDLPLISAYNHLIALVPTVHYALGLINKASAQVGKNVLLQEECDSSLHRAHKLFKNISDAIKRIREHTDYLPQLNIYKENVLHAKQTIAQEQMALAQLQMAHAQQGNTLLKWLKALLWGK
jgi:hypothetical protein